MYDRNHAQQDWLESLIAKLGGVAGTVHVSGGESLEPIAIPLAADEGPRRDTSLEALARLRPAFHATGTVTAGNSSQMSDGAAAVLVMEGSRAKELGLTPMAQVSIASCTIRSKTA